VNLSAVYRDRPLPVETKVALASVTSGTWCSSRDGCSWPAERYGEEYRVHAQRPARLIPYEY
jgi:hypothetical protein